MNNFIKLAAGLAVGGLALYGAKGIWTNCKTAIDQTKTKYGASTLKEALITKIKEGKSNK